MGRKGSYQLVCTVAEMKEKIAETRGNLAAIGRQYGVDRSTIWRYVQKSPTLLAAREDARESMIDAAESTLYDRVLDGNTAELIFFLKTQGWRRGYVERHEQTGADGGPLHMRIELVRSDEYGDDTNTFTPAASWTAISSEEPEAVQRAELGPPVRKNGTGNGTGH